MALALDLMDWWNTRESNSDGHSRNSFRALCKQGGVIAEEIDSGRERVKMYLDDNGKFKGEALVVYFQPESVNVSSDQPCSSKIYVP